MTVFATDALITFLRVSGQVEEFVKQELLARLLDGVAIDPEVEDQAWRDYLSQNQLEQPEALQVFLQRQHLDERLLRRKVTRPHRLIHFREWMWGPLVNGLYLQRKDEFDILTFHMVRSREYNVMQEVYFRLKDGEETWQSICRQLNPDQPETPVLYGPAYRAQFAPELVQHLYQHGTGVISPATTIGGWTVITRLEQITPSTLDDTIRAILLKDRFDGWFAEQQAAAVQTLQLTEQGLAFDMPAAITASQPS